MKRVVSYRVDCQSLDEALKIASYGIRVKKSIVEMELYIDNLKISHYLVSWKEVENFDIESIWGVEE
jgi:hypothetical protein